MKKQVPLTCLSSCLVLGGRLNLLEQDYLSPEQQDFYNRFYKNQVQWA